MTYGDSGVYTFGARIRSGPEGRIRSMQNPPKRFVLFADVLGFKRLVLDHRVPVFESLDFRDPPLANGLSGVRYSRNRIALGFRGFHGAVHTTMSRTAFRKDVELMVFSDSMFLATPDARECLEFASGLMRAGISSEVPLRMGVGFGTFIGYGFSFEQTPALKFSSSQFFGSGVVYATETEKALKGRGMRIGIHKLAADELRREAPLAERLLALPGVCEDVPCEWNYLGDVQPERDVDENERRENLVSHLRRMRDAADDTQPETTYVRGMYSQTIEVLGQMQARRSQ